jgi:DNA-binding LacI/PurR family transcriptional regulator
VVSKTNSTIRDVAALAGVSLMTVTNVVKKRKSTYGRDAEKRVLDAIETLGYRPNSSAQNLRDSLSRSVGFVISDSNPNFLSDPFISQLVSGLSFHLSSIDYSLDIQGVSPEEFESANIVRKLKNDGFCAILSGPKELRDKHINFLSKLEKPIAVFQEIDKNSSPNIIIIREDDMSGAYALGKHLLLKKAKNIVFIRPVTDWSAVEQREIGLRTAVEGNGEDVTCETIISISESYLEVKKVVSSYMERYAPDAIVAATDAMGVAAMHACEELGFKVPKDIKVAGFNGFEAWQYTKPLMTTVVSPAFEMGRIAGETLLASLSDGEPKQKDIVFSTQLRVSNST